MSFVFPDHLQGAAVLSIYPFTRIQDCGNEDKKE